MTSDEVASLTARAVQLYDRDSDDACVAFYDACRRLMAEPNAVAAATAHLASSVPSERGAAALIIGDAVSLHLPQSAASSSEQLSERLLAETDEGARDDLATALGKIWNAYDGDEMPIALARHPNVNMRYAAAQNLAFTTSDGPDDAPARVALKLLKNDPDAGIRRWAVFGLETLSID